MRAVDRCSQQQLAAGMVGRTSPPTGLSPPLHKAGLPQWHGFNGILRQGEQHAQEVLDALPASQKAALGIAG